MVGVRSPKHAHFFSKQRDIIIILYYPHFVLFKYEYTYIYITYIYIYTSHLPITYFLLTTCDSCLGNLGLYSLTNARPISSGSCFVPMELKWMTVIVAGFLASKKTGGWWNELLPKSWYMEASPTKKYGASF